MAQQSDARPFLIHDSLRHLLAYIKETIKDEKIKQQIKEIQVSHTGSAIDDSLADKLLKAEESLLESSQLKMPEILAYAQALVYLFRQLPPLQEHHAYAKSLNSLAVYYQLTGQYSKSFPLYEQSLAIIKKTYGENHPDYAEPLNNLASLYYSTGQYDKCLSLLLKALDIKKVVLGENHPDYAEGLNNLAVIYQEMGRYDRALPLYEQALAIERKALGEDHQKYAETLTNMGSLFSSLGQYEKALSLIEQAAAIYKKTLDDTHPDYSDCLYNLGRLYSNTGQYEKALGVYQQGIEITGRSLGKAHPSYSAHLNNLAFLYVKMKQYDKALPLYQQVLALERKSVGEKHRYFANTLYNLAFLYLQLGQHDSSLLLYQKALYIYEEQLGNQHPSYANCLTELAAAYNRTGNTEKAAALFIQASDIELAHLNRTYTTLSEAGKIDFLGQEAARFNYLPSLLFTQSSSPAALSVQVYQNELALKGMVLEDQQGVVNSIRKSGDSASLRLYESWRSNKAFLGKQFLLPLASRIPYFDSLQEATLQMEQRLSRSSAAFRSQINAQPITPKNIQEKLQDGQTAIEFISFQLYDKEWTDSIMYAALVILPSDTLVHFIPLCEEKRLKQLLAPSSRAATLTDQAVKFNGARALFNNTLYTLIWKPLEKYLDGVRSIYFAPAGLLNRIAFQALKIDSASYVIDKYQLIELLSTRAVAQLQKPLSHGFFLPVAKISREEGLSGNNVFRVQQNPMFRSGLVLAGANRVWKGEQPVAGKEDGILTAYELSQFDLGTTDLVVLSACETALGDISGNEGVLGLQRALRMAGVKNMIVSLWSVPDKQTVQLMTLFYKKWLSGLSPTVSLRQAQLEMKKKYSPYYWAAFVLVE